MIIIYTAEVVVVVVVEVAEVDCENSHKGVQIQSFTNIPYSTIVYLKHSKGKI
jgi:hypothetical protein